MTRQLTLRDAVPRDAELVLALIRELAEYEREPAAVEVDAPTLAAQLAETTPPFECRIAEVDGEPAGFALFFATYSTWRGRRGIHLEDLFVRERFRRLGVGRRLLADVAQVAVERGAARLEWSVLDWNQPAIDFYVRAGAVPLSEWTVFRVTDAALDALAAHAAETPHERA